jgi:single-stranded-DNA-specific exonuclease
MNDFSSLKLIPPEVDKHGNTSDFANQLKAPPFVAQILLDQEIKNLEEARKFFLPEKDQCHDPDLMSGLAQAAKILMSYRNKPLEIVIHGDYDMDGISGTALLYSGLSRLGIAADTFLPNRFLEGYGLCESTIRSFSKKGYSLIITVDTGMTANPEIALAKSLGMQTIVLDHHQPGDAPPEALHILNPHQNCCNYPNPFLCGVGVAYKLISYMFKIAGLEEPYDLLQLFTLGTLADIVPLKGENRCYVKAGIRIMKDSPSVPLAALLKDTGLSETELRSQDILFRITPLLNAPGRLHSPDLALQFLSSSDPKVAELLLTELKQCNEDRRKVEAEITEEAMAMAIKLMEAEDPKVLVLYSENWHQGVIGIVAAKIVDRFNRPAAILTQVQPGIAVASARTVQGFHLHKALGDCEDLLERWGGHYFAAGFSIKLENLPEFCKRIVKVADSLEFKVSSEKVLRCSHNLDFRDINEDCLNWIRRFEPYGPDMTEPLFFADGVSVGGDCRIVGEHHLKLDLNQHGKVFPAIAFGQAHMHNTLIHHPLGLRIAFIPVWNEFRGKRNIQLLIKGIDYPL